LAAPAILSCATAVPPWRFTQEEIFALCGYTSPRIRQIFLHSDINYRHLWLDPKVFSHSESLDQMHARYREGALHLGCLVAREALATAGLDVSQVDCILVASCTGYLCPDLSTLLAGHLGLRHDVQRGALLGHGCAGALPLLQRANDHACSHPGRHVLAIAVEICSATYYLDTSMETIVGNAICADGAAAVILSTGSGSAGAARQGTGDSSPEPSKEPSVRPGQSGPSATNGRGTGPRIVAFQSVLDPSQVSKVGFEQREGRLRIILAAEIRDLAGPIIERCLAGLLASHGLRKEDIRFWILHPGGRKVLDKAVEHLGLTEEQLRFSRHVLRNFGNLSSPTVLFVLSEVWRAELPRPGDFGVLLALGPGFAAEGALLRW